jgi:hypothetical protein
MQNHSVCGIFQRLKITPPDTFHVRLLCADLPKLQLPSNVRLSIIVVGTSPLEFLQLV